MDSKVKNLIRFQNCPRHCKFYYMCLCASPESAQCPAPGKLSMHPFVAQEECQQDALRRVEEAHEQERKKIHQERLERWRRRGELVTISACCCFRFRGMLRWNLNSRLARASCTCKPV